MVQVCQQPLRIRNLSTPRFRGRFPQLANDVAAFGPFAAAQVLESIKFNRFLKLILLEHKPLLACFGFLTRQKWLVSREINLRKRLDLIDSGVKINGSVAGLRH